MNDVDEPGPLWDSAANQPRSQALGGSPASQLRPGLVQAVVGVLLVAASAILVLLIDGLGFAVIFPVCLLFAVGSWEVASGAETVLRASKARRAWGIRRLD